MEDGELRNRPWRIYRDPDGSIRWRLLRSGNPLRSHRHSGYGEYLINACPNSIFLALYKLSLDQQWPNDPVLYRSGTPHSIVTDSRSTRPTTDSLGRLAQLVRAPVSHTGGPQFKSAIAHHLKRAVRSRFKLSRPLLLPSIINPARGADHHGEQRANHSI